MPTASGAVAGQLGDLAEVSARFGAALRLAGLPAGLGRCERFAAAVTVARPATLRALYLCALATLVSSREDAQVLEAVFGQVFGGQFSGGQPGPADASGLGGDPEAADLTQPARPPEAGPPGEQSTEELLAQAALAVRTRVRVDAGEPGAELDEPRPEIGHPYLGSAAERLAAADFAELSDA
ncbi:MAG: hypothetical protein ACRDNZ_20935, partial [Streptosporangiaceae bacterium]